MQKKDTSAIHNGHIRSKEKLVCSNIVLLVGIHAIIIIIRLAGTSNICANCNTAVYQATRILCSLTMIKKATGV